MSSRKSNMEEQNTASTINNNNNTNTNHVNHVNHINHINDDDDNVKDKFIYEDEEHRNNILENLNMLRRNKQFCDVILQIGNNLQEIHEIYAHRVVLASVSTYMLEMFSTDMSGTGSYVQHYKLLNGNYDVEAFDFIVDYAYTGRLEIPREKIKDVYAVANRLKITPVTHICSESLVSNLTADNCLGVRGIRGVLHDPFLLSSVDSYIRQNIGAIAESKCLESLPKIQVELLQSSDEERAATNEKHLYNMVLQWVRQSFETDELNLTNITEKPFMLYLNKSDKILHDCADIETGQIEDSDIVQDYKRLSRKLSYPKNPLTHIDTNIAPSKPRQFLFTRSDSESSLSSVTEDDESDWKVLATCYTGKHVIFGLVTISWKLSVLTVKLTVNSPNITPNNSRNHSIEKLDTYCFVPPMSSARCAVGTCDLNGKLLVCGGYDRGECLKSVEIYDSEKNRWEKFIPMLVPRGRFDLTVLNGNVYAVGGCDGQNELNSAEMYDSREKIWKQLPNCHVARSNSGVCTMEGKIYVIGGWNGQRGLTRCDVFDPETQTWTEINHLQTGRYQVGVAVLDNIIYAVGGCDSWTCLNSVEMYYEASWRPAAFLQTARRGCGVAAYNGKIYAVGGHDGVRALCSVEIYDPKNDQWTTGPSLTSCRANVGLTVVGKRLYAVGGFNGKTFLNTIEFLDSESNEWTSSVSKLDIIDDMNDKGDTDLTNNIKSKVIKVTNEPLVEVEETPCH